MARFCSVARIFFINAVTDIVNSADMIEAAVNLISDTGITILNCGLSAKATNDDYEDKNFKKGIYTNDRKNGDRIHPFSTSESVKILWTVTSPSAWNFMKPSAKE